MAQKTKKPAEEPHLPIISGEQVNKRHHLIAVTIMVGSFLALSIIVGAIAWYYHDRALPNVSLGNVDVSGKTKEEIKQIAESQAKALKITFVEGDKQVEASLSDLGISINVDSSVDQATWARRNWLDLVLAWEHHNVPLVYTSDLGAAKAFAKEKFPNTVTDAQDAQLVFNDQTNSYDIKDGSQGQGFDAVGFVKAIEDMAANPHPLNLTLSTAPVQPVVQSQKLQDVQQEANEVKDLAFKFVYKGTLKYTADPKDIAGWTHFTPNPTNNSVDTTYDQAAILQFLRDKVGPSITTAAQDRKVVVMPDTGKEVVIQSGHEGREIANMEDLSKEILAAVTNKQSLEKEVDVTTSPFKTVTLSGTDRWIEVDLSEQRTSLYLGAEKIATFTISSGIARHPTVTGEFAIRYKTVSQTMTGGSKATGDYYYTPNVTWVSYFYEDYAFHTAYWHNNFGHPMSHGCINMRAADAKTVYDFAPIGTRVIVHA
jgi:lipoprotein-anchoring transpeptidase ErfK/SrfK